MPTVLPQQILVPKKVYIGDLAELRCTFNNPNSELKKLVENGTTELSLVSYSTDNQSDYDIKSINLSPAGVDFYQVTVNFIPWKTGSLQFPPLKIENTDITIEFQPVQIVSLVSTDSNSPTTLRDSAAPLLLPGTAYKLYGSLAGLVVLLIVILRIIIKRKSILFYLDTKRLLRKYKKNKKHTIRSLNKLDTKTSDAVYAESVQKIMRNYLEVRFEYPFTKSVTSELMAGWQSATNNLLSDTKEEAFGNIVASFIRTDFIRYSKDAHFEKDERTELVSKLIDQIEQLEKEEVEKAI